MKRISLTQDQYALVDDEYFEFLNQWKWCAVWYPNTKSYYAVRRSKRDPITKKQKTIRMHRVILSLSNNDRRQVDHVNHDTLDNRRSNICAVTHRENHENRRKQSKYGVGVHFDSRNKSKPFQAQAHVNGKWIHIGMFATAKEARATRKKFLQDNGVI